MNLTIKNLTSQEVGYLTSTLQFQIGNDANDAIAADKAGLADDAQAYRESADILHNLLYKVRQAIVENLDPADQKIAAALKPSTEVLS